MGQPFETPLPESGTADSLPEWILVNEVLRGEATPPDDRLVAARKGSLEDWGELLENCRNYLLMVANLALGGGLRAKLGASDVVQETFLEAQRNRERFRGESEEELQRWLTRILEHKLGNVYRRYCKSAKRDLNREVSSDLEGVQGLFALLPDIKAFSPSSICRGAEDRVRLQKLLAQLPVESALVIRLRVVEDLSFEEIGQRMNRSSEAARKLFGRALLLLQSRWDAPHGKLDQPD